MRARPDGNVLAQIFLRCACLGGSTDDIGGATNADRGDHRAVRERVSLGSRRLVRFQVGAAGVRNPRALFIAGYAKVLAVHSA
ncbi:Hypothetical protein NGAL_HAMBI1146_53460 [Neorhizobium galegae bv. officinalis]|nr:Hypothetical protein NGAL_HAMBI490_59560 [Neorhizobium galegae bv. officinalis]CDZ42579.1 Hypothetical protein NGAL_HAMBI1146_53460 [Neorhizobium galegae bv. officinalis]